MGHRVPLSFPGGEPFVFEMVDTDLLARAFEWAAGAPNARNEIFNVTNGDVFVWHEMWPTVAEAFGMVMAEAIYLGTPVVATRVRGIQEIVEDGVDGVLVPPAHGRALADAIVELLNNPLRLSGPEGAGRDRVQRQFSFERMVRAYEQIYEDFRPECRQSL